MKIPWGDHLRSDIQMEEVNGMIRASRVLPCADTEETFEINVRTMFVVKYFTLTTVGNIISRPSTS